MPGLKKGEQLKKRTQKRKQNQRNNNKVAQRGDFGGQLGNVVQKGLGSTLRMYPETINFAEVYTDPFSIKEARLPFLPIYSTKTVRSIVRANGAIGTNGFGFVTCVPMWGVVNNNDSVFWSQATYTGISIAAAGVGVSSAPASKISYTKASFDSTDVNSLAARCVAYGIRVKYTGTELNSAGEWFAAQTNPKVSMIGFTSDSLRKVQGHKTSTFADRSWHVYNRMITSRLDAEFLNLNSGIWEATTLPGSNAGENNGYIAIIVQGTPGGTFDIEVAGHYEVIGPNLDTEKIGRVDEFNAQNLISTGMKLRHKDNTSLDHTSSLKNEDTSKRLFDFIKDGAKKLIPIIGDLTGTSNIISAVREFMG